MARRRTPVDDDEFEEHVIDVDVSDEMQSSFLEYAYSVIYARALPDARDGLKPVQRRILYSMNEMGLRPDRSHVKCARVVGEVMGKYHPHGDTAIYDTLVRMGQPWAMRLPMIDSHGNFGSLDAGPAAMRYTEARMAPVALAMTEGLELDTVDFRPNYDGHESEPAVMPASFPNLLVNGSTGIAVGMATNIPPHNLIEVVHALRHLLAHPDADLDAIMRFIPGPDFPTGGTIVGLSGIREGYETGRGSLKIRARARIEQITARKKGIVFTELPYMIGPEKIIEQIKTLVQAKKLQGISDIKDLSDLQNPTRLVIEVKNGINPEALLEQLYRKTKLEDSFGINTVALVEGQPRTLGLIEALQVYLEHRLEVTLRKALFQRAKAEDRLHLVEGLLIAILDIDHVIAIIRQADDAAAARIGLTQAFELSELQANYILDMQLRRLTKYSRIELEGERDELSARIAELTLLIDSEERRRRQVGDDLLAVAKAHGDARRTVLLSAAGVSAAGASTPRVGAAPPRGGGAAPPAPPAPPCCGPPPGCRRRRPPPGWRPPTTPAGWSPPPPDCSPGPRTTARCPPTAHVPITTSSPRSSAPRHAPRWAWSPRPAGCGSCRHWNCRRCPRPPPRRTCRAARDSPSCWGWSRAKNSGPSSRCGPTPPAWRSAPGAAWSRSSGPRSSPRPIGRSSGSSRATRWPGPSGSTAPPTPRCASSPPTRTCCTSRSPPYAARAAPAAASPA